MERLIFKCMTIVVTSFLLLALFAAFGGREYKDVTLEIIPIDHVVLVAQPLPPIEIVDSKSMICLAENIYHEARSEPREGRKAVAIVTLNRVNDHQFPDNVCDVVKQRRGKICQFSWYCGKEKYKILTANNRHYIESMDIAQYVLLNYDKLSDMTDGALFYHADYVSLRKIGVANLEKTTKIGRHIFYKQKIGNKHARKTESTDGQRERGAVNLLAYGRNQPTVSKTLY